MQVAFEVNNHNIALYVKYVTKENLVKKHFLLNYFCLNASYWKRFTKELSC